MPTLKIILHLFSEKQDPQQLRRFAKIRTKVAELATKLHHNWEKRKQSEILHLDSVFSRKVESNDEGNFLNWWRIQASLLCCRKFMDPLDESINENIAVIWVAKIICFVHATVELSVHFQWAHKWKYGCKFGWGSLTQNSKKHTGIPPPFLGRKNLDMTMKDRNWQNPPKKDSKPKEIELKSKSRIFCKRVFEIQNPDFENFAF